MKKNIAWGVLGIGLLAFLLFFPKIFNWWALHVWNVPPKQIDELVKLGPLGDLYGSLNTLFTSATLVIVIYSTLLQRQANQDARKAVVDQLQQTKDATNDQLLQAKDALEAQLTQSRDATAAQLDQAREATKQQLDLAQLTHDTQIKESKNAIFMSQFFALLNYKNERINSLAMTDSSGRSLVGYQIFQDLVAEMMSLISVEDPPVIVDDLTPQKLREFFDISSKKLNNNKSFYEIFSYFDLYTSIIDLVKNAQIEDEEKFFYWTLIRNPMTAYEQLALFYLAPVWERLHISLDDSFLFNSFSPQPDVNRQFAFAFYKKNNFYTQPWFDIYDNIKPQPKSG